MEGKVRREKGEPGEDKIRILSRRERERETGKDRRTSRAGQTGQQRQTRGLRQDREATVWGAPTFVRPGLGCARRRAGHFGGQPIHIPKVGQNPLQFDPPALCGDKAQGGRGVSCCELDPPAPNWGLSEARGAASRCPSRALGPSCPRDPSLTALCGGLEEEPPPPPSSCPSTSPAGTVRDSCKPGGPAAGKRGGPRVPRDPQGRDRAGLAGSGHSAQEASPSGGAWAGSSCRHRGRSNSIQRPPLAHPARGGPHPQCSAAGLPSHRHPPRSPGSRTR